MSKKEDYEKKLQSQLDEWKEDIDKLKAKAEKAGSEAQAEYRKQLQALKKKQDEAKEKLSELQHHSSDAWEDLKVGIDMAWEDLKEAIKSANARFK